MSFMIVVYVLIFFLNQKTAYEGGISDWSSDVCSSDLETVFAMPQVLNYSTGGMIYGAKLLDATQGLRIDDPVYATNLNEHFKQCVFYDILLGRKTYDDILKSPDLLTAMGDRKSVV